MMARLLTSLFSLAVLATPSLAQSPSEPAPAATPAPANSPAPSTKKVWTNEELPAGKGGVSVVGDKKKQNSPAPGQTADAATVDRIRKNLEKLQDQLEDINKKLKSYKEFLAGEPVSTGSVDFDKGITRVPVDQQVLQLQDKKKKLEAQISDLYDEARKKGIDPGQLR